MSLEVKTDDIKRPLKSFNDLPESVKPDFDYQAERDVTALRFVQFGDDWYDACDSQSIQIERGQRHEPMGWAMYVTEDSPLASWAAVISESYWTGKLFRFVDDNGTPSVIVGSYHAKG